MSFVNPKLYNYKNLNNEDKKIIDGMLSLIDLIDVEINREKRIQQSKKEKTISKAQSEIKQETLEKTKINFECLVVGHIKELIDKYPGEIKEQDNEAESYFMGSSRTISKDAQSILLNEYKF